MSYLLGAIRQLGFVVRDMDVALKYWTETLGVGPFFVLREQTPTSYWYRGEPSPPPTLHIALGNSDDLQVELIEQLGPEPTAYRDFLDAGREGFHHVSSWLTRDEYDRTMARTLSSGVKIAQEGQMGDGGVRWAYFATDSAPDQTQFEIADVLDLSVYSLFESLARMSKEWDGRDPIREIGNPAPR